MTTNDYKEIIAMAINNEIEAYEFYSNAAEKSKSANLKATFIELAEEEMNHKKTLEAFLNNEGKQMQFQSVTDYKITESVELPKLTSEMSFADGIALAMKKEEEAMLMYSKFAEASTVQSQKETFMQLAKMEQGHKVKLENLYSNTAYTEVW
ncbi:MAG: ferritin family protein [Bacteroidales bacterium]|nr:ferritin family protein [Bacteroidales bacterium]